MSKKGQDNQRGVSFQNKAALLYMLDHYRYENFAEIRFEGSSFEDFTLFFSDPQNNSAFFYNFEVKNWASPLSANDIKKIIGKEIQKSVSRYSEKGKFFIAAPSFKQECGEIKSFKKKYFFNSKQDFEQTKKLYQKVHGKNYLLDSWSKEEILFLRHVHLAELKKEDDITNMIIDRFHYEDSFFYSDDNLENIISRFLKKITDRSSQGRSLKKGDIRSILDEFQTAETQKSESYSLDDDLGQKLGKIEDKLKSEDEFKTLDSDRFITPVSSYPKAIFYIADNLRKKNFKLANIKWFVEKILIKKCYFFQCLRLLEKYTEPDILTKKDENFILNFVFKIYEKNSSENSVSNRLLLELLFKICSRQTISEPSKNKIISFLEGSVPDWNKDLNSCSWDSYNYQHVPALAKKLFNCSREGLEFIFKKHNFANDRESQTEYNRGYYEYIEEFIDKDFKKHFPLAIKELSAQFQRLYKIYGYDYKGYEITGGSSGFGNNYAPRILPMESVLSSCIIKFYKEAKDWEYLYSFVHSKHNKNNPVIVKRSLIPFLLSQLKESDETDPEDNRFYKALESVLKIKKGIPFVEDILINELRHIHLSIKDNYLEKLIKAVLYKYSEDGISYSILTIQFLFQLIEDGKFSFKPHLRKILLNEAFKKYYIYDRALRLFESKITNQNINSFFNEIKNELNISQSPDLIYRSVILNLQSDSFEKSELSRLFNSSSEKDLNCLASVIEKDLWNAGGSNLKEAADFMKNHPDLEGFYNRIRASEDLKRAIAQLAERAVNYDAGLSERIIDLCAKDTNLCGESEKLHSEVSKGEQHLSISTMRAHLCYAINSYVVRYNSKTDKQALAKLEKAFFWIKQLIDLDEPHAVKIGGFPRPNYYLRSFAIMPLINLAHHEIRARLNKFKAGLGDEIKKLAFSIIERTKGEIEENKYTPYELFSKISILFDYIKDLNENEAEKLLSFIERFRIAGADHFFIYYALCRKDYFKEKGKFNSAPFKERLRNVCKSEPDQLKNSLSFTIYKIIENKRADGRLRDTDFEFFEMAKDYWILLFENVSKNMLFPLLMTLSFVLKNKSYYHGYKKYFFQLIEKALKKWGNSNEYFLHLNHILPAVSENSPDDLAEILFLFLDKGDPSRGYIPFIYEARHALIPEISKARGKISKGKLSKAEQELAKYGLSL